jgi:hypothetical protein
MAAKKKLMPTDIDLDLDAFRAAPGGAQAQAAFHETPVGAENSKPGLKENAINMSIYILREDHRRLRMLAADEETSIQALVMDGIDAVLKQRGQDPVARWEPRRKPR